MPIGSEPIPGIAPPEVVVQSSVDDLVKEKNINGLLALKDNPDAQFGGFVLLLNHTRRFNVRNRQSQEQLQGVNIDLIASKVGLNQDEATSLKTGRSTIKVKFDEYEGIEQEIKDEENWSHTRFGEEREQLNQKINLLREKSRQLNNEIEVGLHQVLFPAREKILLSPAVPEDLKLEVIEGLRSPASSAFRIDQYQPIDSDEDRLLRNVYRDPNSSERVRQDIKKVALARLGTDPNAITIVPLKDFDEETLDKVFIAAAGNRFTNLDLFDESIAPLFFPDQDAEAIRQSWEVLSKVTHGGVADFIEARKTRRFASDGANYNTASMNREIFLDFVNNSKELVPLVEMLSEYGFNYRPVKSETSGFKYSPEYVQRLKELVQNIPQLKEDLDTVRQMFPRFMYMFQADHDAEPLKGNVLFIKDNPYAMAFDQFLKYNEYGPEHTLNEGLKLLDKVPDRWKDTYMRTFLTWITERVGWNRELPQQAYEKVIKTANMLIYDPHVSDDTLERVATPYLDASLRPHARNVEAAYNFLRLHADKIGVNEDGKYVADKDRAWLQFVLRAGDVYRYSLDGNNDIFKINQVGRDFDLAYRALSEIQDPKLGTYPLNTSRTYLTRG